MRGNVKDNFEHVKGYRVFCYGRNILLKFKGGDLVREPGQPLARPCSLAIRVSVSFALPMHCTFALFEVLPPCECLCLLCRCTALLLSLRCCHHLSASAHEVRSCSAPPPEGATARGRLQLLDEDEALAGRRH